MDNEKPKIPKNQRSRKIKKIDTEKPSEGNNIQDKPE